MEEKERMGKSNSGRSRSSGSVSGGRPSTKEPVRPTQQVGMRNGFDVLEDMISRQLEENSQNNAKSAASSR